LNWCGVPHGAPHQDVQSSHETGANMISTSKLSLLSFILGFSIIGLGHTQSNSGKNKSVLIIKAAGFVEGQKPEGVDAITEATSFGRNVHVITDALQRELKRIGVESEVVPFNDYPRMLAISNDSTVDLIVFSGPAYSSQFPQQLRDVVPKLKENILREKIVCTSMTSCRFLDSGQWTVKSFNDGLKNLGIPTIDGLAIHHEYEDQDWESKILEFAGRLKRTLKIKNSE
jgi:hypothetical protein